MGRVAEKITKNHTLWCSMHGSASCHAMHTEGRAQQTLDPLLCRVAHLPGALLALAVVVVDVDGLAKVGRFASHMLHRPSQQVHHDPPVVEGILLAPVHVLHRA